MPRYRAYRLDDAGNSVSCSELDALNDEDAMEIVRVLPEQLGFEVWCDMRIVGRIGRNDKAVPPRVMEAPVTTSP
jgi:hypothetical protein